MPVETIEALRRIIFVLKEYFPMLQELWMHLLNILANYG